MSMLLRVDEAGIYPDLDEEQYHRDELVPGGSLSSTGARRILESPARYKWDAEHPKQSAAFDLGKAVHAKILGVGAQVIGIPDEHLTASGSVSTKAATVAWVREQRDAGLVVLSANELAAVNAMVEAVLAHDEARRLLEQPDGLPEASVFSQDPDTGVWLRARFDLLAETPVDVKTCLNASASGFGSSAAKYGYPVQEAHYADALRFTGEGDVRPMSFIAVEKFAPYLVAVHEFPIEARLTGSNLAAQARQTYAECKATDSWPGYGSGVITTNIPGWFYYQLDDEPEIEVA